MGCRPMASVMFYAFMRGRVQRAQRDGGVLEHIKDRVEDVLFFCVTGLVVLKRPFWEVYPQSVVQRCIVHMIEILARG
ncbi:MAG: hypothetical protein R2788_07365 [Saprospiraceae bacterium]